MVLSWLCSLIFFFFNDTATTEIYTLSLHDALPICPLAAAQRAPGSRRVPPLPPPGNRAPSGRRDRKSTRLNSSHSQISYAVFCLKKKKKKHKHHLILKTNSNPAALSHLQMTT